MHLFGIDWNGPIPHDDEAAIVDVPTVETPLSDQAGLCGIVQHYLT